MKKFKSIKQMPFFLVLLFVLIVPKFGLTQVNMSSTGNYSQDFDDLINSSSSTWTDNSTISNWYSQRTGTGTSIVANDGGANGGNLYSYGTGTSSDRALGTVGSGNSTAGSFAHGVLLRNTSGTTITSITVSYTLEQWRYGGTAATQSISFYYRTSASSFTSLNPNNNSAWTSVAALNLSSPITTGSARSLDGNSSANQASAASVSLTGLSLANNSYIMLKWEDPDHSGNDHGLSIDDVTVNWTVPPSIAISADHPTASNFALGSTNNIVASFQLDVTNNNATLNSVGVNTSGSYLTSDIQANGFKFWINSTNDLNGAPTQLGSNQAVVASSGSVTVSGLSSTITSGSTRYILFTADIAASAVNGRTIGVTPTAFSKFTFSSGTKTGTDPVAASNASSLPIKLISFSATRQNNQAQLTFSTATEENNNFFAIERSGNGTDFRTIGKVNGAGTTTSIQNYSFTDETPLSGINYYRLKQVDFDGQFTYSPVVNVVFDNKAGIRLAPTPVQDQLRVELEEMFQEDAQWQLYDFAGRLVQTGVLSAENMVFNVEVGSLTPGNYVIRVVSGQTTLTKQFQK